MQKGGEIKTFQETVENKFSVYNSLFLSLPFRQIRKTGVLIPLLQKDCQDGLDAGREPLEILDSFFASRSELDTERDNIDFMFRVIQYVERQVVLFDSVEDAAFSGLQDSDEHLSLKDYFRLTEEQTTSASSLTETRSKLSSFCTRIVFTAHPTQFYPPSVLKIIAKLRSFISTSNVSRIDQTLQQLGLTSLLQSDKPTPLEEAKNIIYFLRYVYFDAVGELYADLRKSSRDDAFGNTKIVQLGFWPGGDRDGNPFVTSETTLAVANELRMTLMKCYYKELKELEGKLTFPKVESPLAKLTARVYDAMFDPETPLTADQISAPLRAIRSLLSSDYNDLFREELELLIDKVAIFKTHFASLDIRQNHSVHKRLITTILTQRGVIESSLDELDPDALIQILLRTDITIEAKDFEDDLMRDTILTINQIQEIQRKNGVEGCNRYIISNSEDVYSVLFVFALFRWCWNEDDIQVDIIPLFETVYGMTHAASIMGTLFSLPAYRSHLAFRDNTQTIMLGFSDGTKDGGYLQANWSIHRTKEELSTVCDDVGIKAIFFDGRGGPPARGGGKTHRFYASQSRLIADHAIELTIQGQVITSMYGTKEQFKHQCEQLIAAGIRKDVFHDENNISENSRALFDELASLSYEKYTALKSHPMFIPYLEKKSTLRFYSRANVGSRPARRGNDETLELKNLRAIPFVGSWSQLKQNVPGYFGIGTALKSVVDDGRLEDLQALFRDVPFFKTLILGSMMSLTKCSFGLTSYIARDKEFGPFWNMLLAEFELSREMVLLISGYTELMEEEPLSKSSIAIREEIVLPLLVIQQYALQKIELNSENGEVYEKIVTRSLYGNINASRNSA